MSDKSIIVTNVSKTYYVSDDDISSIKELLFKFFRRRKKRKINALKDITFSVNKGEVLGIIGRNGSGKSTLLKIILGAIPADKGGIVQLNGTIIRLSLGIGFDQNLSARDNIYLNGSILGLSMKEIGKNFNRIIQFAELEKFVDTKIKYFSKGMKSRLAFAIAIHAQSDILLLDEFFGGVGDINFRKKSNSVFNDTVVEGRTILFVSHQLGEIQKYCDRVVYLENGLIRQIGTPEEIIEQYKTDNKSAPKNTSKTT